MNQLNTDDLEYGEVETLSYYNIVEVALRHGFDPSLKEEFFEWIKEQVEEHIDYARWEESMGEDL